MDKKTILVGIGAVALAGYLIWKQSQNKTKANAVGSRGEIPDSRAACKDRAVGAACVYKGGSGATLFGRCQDMGGGDLQCRLQPTQNQY